MKRFDDYYGRVFTKQELTVDERDQAEKLPSTFSKGKKIFCARCSGAMVHQLPRGGFYCRDCILMGRVASDEDLFYFPQQGFSKGDFLTWQGELTEHQARVSAGLLEAQKAGQDILVHAVTGAGKTEMIYQVVAQVLAAGGSVALVSPRIDVCRELHPRLSRDFSCPISLLYGGSDPYSRSPLVISTVHQLYRFYQAFDLIIIDEVDAFPFVDNDSLYYAVDKALKPTGSKIFLTATTTDKLDNAIKKGQLKQLHLARRFHGNPLVVPQPVWLGGLLDCLAKGKLPKKFLFYIDKQSQTGFPLLIFFPHIEMGKNFTQVLSQYLPEEKIGFVSSQTEDRKEEVEKFRSGDLRILVTTTILERGVTFPKVDVFVLWSNHRLYTKSSLVQIAGRVGRSFDRPTGELIFFHDGLTKSIKKAVAEIKDTNKKGGF